MSRFSVGDCTDDSFDPYDHDRPVRQRRARVRDEEPEPQRTPPPAWDQTDDDPDLPDGATRSTYQESRASQGPQPPPAWLVTTSAALDYERGIVKTGKEADVDLIERIDPTTGASCLLAAKRYRSAQHRLFHRDSGYLEGRRVRRSRETRAMANRTAFGREVIAGQWAFAEFETLGRLWSAGLAVPYPVQFGGTEILLEFIGDADGIAAPRLAELRPSLDELDDLWRQCRAVLTSLAALGWSHGDLSAYNLLVHEGRLVMIDLPQVVDIVGNPQGVTFLQRDCENICRWFTARGQADAHAATLTAELTAEAGM